MLPWGLTVSMAIKIYAIIKLTVFFKIGEGKRRDYYVTKDFSYGRYSLRYEI